MKRETDSKMHSAEHILNGTMVKMFGCNRCFSAHLNRKKSKCDYRFDRNLTPEEIADIEKCINEIIEADMPVIEEFMPKSLAKTRFDLERLPEDAGNDLRIVRIGDYDVVPCIGKHVFSTCEIGVFRITTTSFEDGILRIRFKLKS